MKKNTKRKMRLGNPPNKRQKRDRISYCDGGFFRPPVGSSARQNRTGGFFLWTEKLGTTPELTCVAQSPLRMESRGALTTMQSEFRKVPRSIRTILECSELSCVGFSSTDPVDRPIKSRQASMPSVFRHMCSSSLRSTTTTTTTTQPQPHLDSLRLATRELLRSSPASPSEVRIAR